jgi:hypothetical protein
MKRLAILCVLFIAAPLAAADDGFDPLFDGKSLDGWKTFDPSYWSIKDGAITATITKEHPLRENRYLIWQGNAKAPQGQMADFELKLKSRVRGEGASATATIPQPAAPSGWDIACLSDRSLNIGGVSHGWAALSRRTLRPAHLSFGRENDVPDETGKVTKEPIKEVPRHYGLSSKNGTNIIHLIRASII